MTAVTVSCHFLGRCFLSWTAPNSQRWSARARTTRIMRARRGVSSENAAGLSTTNATPAIPRQHPVANSAPRLTIRVCRRPCAGLIGLHHGRAWPQRGALRRPRGEAAEAEPADSEARPPPAHTNQRTHTRGARTHVAHTRGETTHHADRQRPPLYPGSTRRGISSSACCWSRRRSTVSSTLRSRPPATPRRPTATHLSSTSAAACLGQRRRARFCFMLRRGH